MVKVTHNNNAGDPTKRLEGSWLELLSPKKVDEGEETNLATCENRQERLLLNS